MVKKKNGNQVIRKPGKQRRQANSVLRTNEPSVSSHASGIRVRHREYLSSISLANAGFEVYPALGPAEYGSPKTLHLNAADGEVFPWLSRIAPNFEHYKFNSLRFNWSSSVSSFTTGSLLMVPEFDPHNERVKAPDSLTELMNKQHAVTGNVWSNFSLNIPTSKMPKKLCRATHNVTHSSEHLRQTDIGNVYIALYNAEPTTIPYGEIFVEYDVTLTNPNYTGQTVKFHHYENKANQTVGISHAALLGDINGTPAMSTNEPGYIATEGSTLGVMTHFEPSIGVFAGNDADSTRFTFQEPFNGIMHFRGTNQSGAMSSSANPTAAHLAAGFNYTITPDNLATVKTVQRTGTGGAGADWQAIWNIAAKAGDIVDFLWDTIGSIDFDETAVTLVESAGILV